ncbi:MAG: histidine--tRNA ligase [Chloroflexi bacterium]|nr:MAG: histidine--tRNA ligase [Chloroflexota bacterium]
MDKFSRPTGTQDILPEEQPYWEYVTASAAALARRYGFERLDTPIFEATGLFARGVGVATDVVEKEMYSFKDKGGHPLTLRPEFTAGVVRAYIENGMRVLPKPVKLYSVGPIFRYERPQAGRFRQFHQFNIEIIGIQDPLADLETMLLAWDLYAGLNFQGLSFQLNSTGCPVCRPRYIETLVAYYRQYYDQICEDCKRRLETNPLRVLDCKRAQCQPVIAGAPQIAEHLCEDCATHFATLRGYLDDLGKPYTINPRLVRGLDYYTKTVFEVWAADIGAQSAVCGGGRYDGLSELLGGRPTPAVGFAAGLERIIMVMKNQGVSVPVLPTPPVFIVTLEKAARFAAVRLLVEARSAGLGVQIAMSGSLKSQLRQANKRGARFALIVGGDELARGEVQLKDLAQGAQEAVPLAAVSDVLRRRLSR